MNHSMHSTFHSRGDSYLISETVNDLGARLAMIQDKISLYDIQFLKMTELLRAQKDYLESKSPPESYFESVFTDFLARINDIEKSVQGVNRRISGLENKFHERNFNDSSGLKQRIQDIYEQSRHFHDDISYRINNLHTSSFNTPQKQKQDSRRDQKKYKKTRSIRSRRTPLSRKSSVRSRR